MITRSDVTSLARATKQVSDESVKVIKDIFGALDFAKEQAARDVLLETVPAVVQEFGDLSSSVAAEWYEVQRGKNVGGRYVAVLGEPAPREAVEGSVRWAAGQLWSATPGDALELLGGAVQRHVTMGARNTIVRNSQVDRAKPRWAHVPSGPDPCPFCVVMSSRGWVYSSKESAALHGEFHDNCRCMVVPSWDWKNAHIRGYDPDAAYDMYLSAREPGEPLSQTVSRMRSMYPDVFPVKS